MADEIKNFEPGNPDHINRTPGDTTWAEWLKTNNAEAIAKMKAGQIEPFVSVFVGRDFLLEILKQDQDNPVGIMFWINTHEKDGKEYMTLSLQGVRETGLPYNGVNDSKFVSLFGCPPDCDDWLQKSA